MASLRTALLLACCCGVVPASQGGASEPVSAAQAVLRDQAFARQERTRHLIQERAHAVAQARSARISARKQAGISLQRPVIAMPWQTPAPNIERVDRGIRLDR